MEINEASNDEPELIVKRKIRKFDDLKHWMTCTGYQDLTSFIRQLNMFATAKHDGFSNLDSIKHVKLIELRNLLDTLSAKVDEIKPFSEDKNQRFGNKAYRVWFEEMQTLLDNFFKQFDEENSKELKFYLEDSFGNKQRIDYGTGHELNFIIFLMGFYKLGEKRLRLDL